MIAPARAGAFSVLLSVETTTSHSDDLLHSHCVSCLDPRDRALATEIVLGTLRWQARLDHYAQPLATRPWTEVDTRVRVVLRMSLYQLWRLERVPPHAVVNDAVELARGAGIGPAAGFVNAVLRQALRRPPWKETVEMPAWVAHSVPEWLWRRWESRFGLETVAEYADSLNSPAVKAARACPAGSAQEGLPVSDLVPGCVLPGEDHVTASQSGTSPLRFQDEASQLIPHLFGLVRGCAVWDACAAPGGKSAILRDLVGREGMVLSSELDLNRSLRLREFLAGSAAGERHAVLRLNATVAPPFMRMFDAVLADVPCSGLGTLRRNPEIRWRVRAGKLKQLARLQENILEAVCGAVRPGGLLLYATCSTEPEENEAVVGRFVSRHPEFRVVPPAAPPGIDSWTGLDLFVRTFPSTRRWDGFFAALMLRE